MTTSTANATEPRYRIRRPAPRPYRISDFGLARSDDGEDLDLLTTIEAELTPAEFHAIFGPNASITEAMIQPVSNADGWDVTLTHEHVLGIDQVSTMQSYAIRALLTDAGENAPARLRALSVKEISPAALHYLLEAKAKVEEQHGVDPMDEMSGLSNAGLGLPDFCAYE